MCGWINKENLHRMSGDQEMGNRAVSLAARDNWSGHPNLSLRPHAPNKGKGVLQRQIRRAFIAGGPVLTTPQIKAWTGDHGGGWPQATLWRDLMAVAEPIGRASTRGRPWIWRLRRPDGVVGDVGRNESGGNQ